MATFVNLTPGDPAPWFTQNSSLGPGYRFHLSAGRYVVLCFFGSAADKQGSAAVAAALNHSSFFDDKRGTFYGVSIDPSDRSEGRAVARPPGHRFLWDFDGQVSKLFGSVALDDNVVGGSINIRRFWMVLDPILRVMKTIPFAAGGRDIAELFDYLASLPPVDQFPGFEVHAPILIVPNTLEPELCKRLVDIFEQEGGRETGSMRDIDGVTTEVHDYRHKRRKDVMLADRGLIEAVHTRIRRRLLPEIARIHNFSVTHIERNLIACYDSTDGGHFGPHRDNTTKGTAHRRFAVSINLNDAFEGGELSFPEYGRRAIKPSAGCAIVFSCSMLHRVSKVTSGRRYAFLPFLYDEAAANIRQQNLASMGSSHQADASPDGGAVSP